MKNKIITSLKQLLADRVLFVLIVIMILQAVTFALVIGLSVKYNGRQLISHYSAFGGTQFYLGQWFYLFVFVIFAFIIMVINTLIIKKMLFVKGHSLAVAYTCFSIGITFFSWIMVSRILELQALL